MNNNEIEFEFNEPITGLGIHEDKLIVFKEKSIGLLEDNGWSFLKTESYINGIGNMPGSQIELSKINGKDVLKFSSCSGRYAFDGSNKLIRLDLL